MKELGFLTSSEDPNLIDDDRLAFPYLTKLGFSVSPVVWDQPGSIGQMDFDALIFRSCWNYHRKYPEFLSWIAELKKLQIPILNPINIIEWNLNKKHLLELAEKIAVPKTKWLERGTLFSTKMLEQTAADWQVDQLVIKPAVSLNGHDTYLVPVMGFETMKRTISSLIGTRDIIIQEFVSEIRTQGETSLIFFNRKFSHAVRKVPTKNEFRVHKEYGGSREATEPSHEALTYSQNILDLVETDLLYARVDVVERDNGPILIELEVTDPMFYLHTNTAAPQNFANAIAAVL